jgi:hypothetical protein
MSPTRLEVVRSAGAPHAVLVQMAIVPWSGEDAEPLHLDPMVALKRCDTITVMSRRPRDRLADVANPDWAAVAIGDMASLNGSASII